MQQPKQTANTPQWLLDRMAERAPEVVARNEHKSELIAGFATTLPEIASTYRTQYAAVDLNEREVRRLSIHASTEVNALSSSSRTWVQRLSRYLSDFDVAPLSHTEVPTDVITGARRLLERTRYLVDEQQHPLPYVGQLVAHLQPLIERAETAQEAHRTAQVALQEQRAELRKTAVRFEDELIALRRTLRDVLGSTHRDYHYLRVRDRRGSQLSSASLELPEAARELSSEPPANLNDPQDDPQSDAAA